MLIEESLIEIMNPVRSVKKCSFCRCAGHTINICNDERITCFEELCQLKKWEYNSNNEPRRRFAMWLVVFLEGYGTSSVIRAFAVRKCNALSRSTLGRCIHNIIYYFYGDITNDMPIYVNNKYKMNMIYVNNPVVELISEALCDCSICLEAKINSECVTLNCNHMFCGACIVGVFANNKNILGPSCALCRETIKTIKYADITFENKIIEYVDL